MVIKKLTKNALHMHLEALIIAWITTKLIIIPTSSFKIKVSQLT